MLLWQVRGTTDVVIAGERVQLTVGNALWIPMGVQHRFTVQENSVALPLFFDVAQTATTLHAPTLVRVDGDLRALMLAHNASSGSAITPEANISRQLLALMENVPVVSEAIPIPTQGPARVVAESLQFNPGDIRTAEELAEAAHASLRTIERAFKAQTGMTLRQWRIRHRMDAAAVLLRSATSVDAVAHRVGYRHVNAFRRVFTTHHGMTPSQYLRKYAQQ